MTRLYKENTKSWDTYKWVLTLCILTGYKIALSGPICSILKTSPTNSDLVVLFLSDFKGSGTLEYPKIAPDFALNEHYYPTLGRNSFQSSEIVIQIKILSSQKKFLPGVG